MKSLIFTAESIQGLQRALRGELGGKFQTRRYIPKRAWMAWQSCGGELADGVPVLEDDLGNGINLADILPIQPGDVVRAKESHATHCDLNDIPISKLRGQEDIWYLADRPFPDWLGRTRSPMFMPAWASRYFLPITAVRVERLQDITEDDAVAEGYLPEPGMWTAKFAYMEAFERINGKGAWDANPWVTVDVWAEVLTEAPGSKPEAPGAKP